MSPENVASKTHLVHTYEHTEIHLKLLVAALVSSKMSSSTQINTTNSLIHTHRIHVWYIYLHEWLISMLNVGKYTNPMDS